MSVPEGKTAREWYELTTIDLENMPTWERLPPEAKVRWDAIAKKKAKGELIDE